MGHSRENKNHTCNKKDTDSQNDKDGFGYGFNFGCNDIPGGFQEINPQLFVVIGEILGDAIAGKLPFNVQNAIGNWLQLVGQAIETYNAQQQYFQGGPGRYYNPKYYNVNNPFCGESNNYKSEGNSNSSTGQDNMTDEEKTKNDFKDFEGLKKKIEEMQNKIEQIEKKMNDQGT